MVILSPMGGSTEPRTAPPWSFTLDVPRDDVGGSGSLVGAQPIYAVFRRCGSDPNPQAACNQGSRDFPSTELDVEDPSPATKLWSRLPLLSFVSVDDSDYLNIVAFFADGLQLEVTRSTRISFSSTNPAVALVDENGHVTRTGAGKAEIEVTYIGGGATTRLSIPVDSWILRNADQSDQDQNSNSTR